MSPAEREAFWRDLGRPAASDPQSRYAIDDEVRTAQLAWYAAQHAKSLGRSPDAHLGAVGGE